MHSSKIPRRRNTIACKILSAIKIPVAPLLFFFLVALKYPGIKIPGVIGYYGTLTLGQGYSIELKKDHTFIFHHYNCFGGSVSEGKWQFSGGHVTLDSFSKEEIRNDKKVYESGQIEELSGKEVVIENKILKFTDESGVEEILYRNDTKEYRNWNKHRKL